jgi:hypothetical protein
MEASNLRAELDKIIMDLVEGVDGYMYIDGMNINPSINHAKQQIQEYIEQQVLIGRKAELEKMPRSVEFDRRFKERYNELDRLISKLKGGKK